MEAEVKRISMSIEYSNRNDMLKAVKYFLNQIKDNKTNYDRLDVASAFLEWKIEKTKIDNYRVEYVDGIAHMVIPSKMNEV